MAKRLWDKGEALNEQIHRFTVGSDPVVDLGLLYWDILASGAHVHVLATAGVLTEDEKHKALRGLSSLLPKAGRGEIEIPDALEDCHTTLESELVELLGDLGKKIHTGRSRNDQVLVAMRLYLKNQVLAIGDCARSCCEALATRATAARLIPLPGYTHFQPAMPASVEMWLSAFEEHMLDVLRAIPALLIQIDSNPLGVASGFSVPLKLDREVSTKLLGFERVQRNPMHVQNCRGREELLVLRWCSDIAGIIEKFACDFMLFSMEEFRFFSLPAAFTTGSSIMPQKRNPDVIELLRGSAAKVRAAEFELGGVISKLPSSYHRDFQLTKEPLVKGCALTAQLLTIFTAVVEAFVWHPEQLKAAMHPELYATYAVYRRVREGHPFRDAYTSVGAELKQGTIDLSTYDGDFGLIQESIEKDRQAAARELGELQKQLAGYRKTEADSLQRVFG